MEEKKLTQQEKMKKAKSESAFRLAGVTMDWLQIGEYDWASMEEVNGEELWVVCSLTAKKPGFDIEEAMSEWSFKKKEKEEKEKNRRARESKKNGIPMGPSLAARAAELE